MAKLKIILVATVAVLGASLPFSILHQSQNRRRASDTALQEERAQMAALSAEHERLSNLAAHAKALANEDHGAELQKLRREAGALKKQVEELDSPLEQSQTLRRLRPAISAELRTPEVIAKMQRLNFAARDLGTAFRSYAEEHQNQSPSNFDQLTSYLDKLNVLLSDVGNFEIVYHGSLDELQGLPFGSVAVVRSVQTWPNSNGKLTRIYGFADGHGQTVESDDNFRSWEAQHVISSPPLNQ